MRLRYEVPVMHQPLISIIMPMKNAEQYVVQAIQSVLTQSGVTVEVIAVDDQSTDRTVALVEGLHDPRIIVISNPSGGVAAGYNAGLAAARGVYVGRCDADDIFVPNRLSEQVEFLERSSAFGACAGGFRMITSRGRRISDLTSRDKEGEITRELRAGETRTSFCTFLCRSDVVRAVGACRRFFLTGEDIDLQLRLAEVARIHYLARPVYDYRLNGQSITHTEALSRNLYFETCARLFQRQRLEGGVDDLQAGRSPPTLEDLGLSASSARGAAQHAQEMFIGAAWRYHKKGQRMLALRAGLHSVWAAPMRADGWKAVLMLAIK